MSRKLLETEEMFMEPTIPMIRFFQHPEEKWIKYYLAPLRLCMTETLETEMLPKMRISRHEKREEPHIIIHGRNRIDIYLPIRREIISHILKRDDPIKILIDYMKEQGLLEDTANKLLKENIQLANKIMQKNKKYVEEIEKKGIDRKRIAILLTLYFTVLDMLLI